MNESTTARSAVEGFPVFFDAADAGLPPTQFTEFQIRGGSLRTGYRTGYAFDPPGPFFLRVGGAEFTINVARYAPAGTVRVRQGTTEADLPAMLAEGVDLVWDADAVVTLTKVLPVTFKNVRWINARLDFRPATHADKVFIDVTAPGFRVENLAVTGVLPWQWVKEHTGTCDVFHVHHGGSLVCRPTRRGMVDVRDIDTFCHVGPGAAGVVIEKPVFRNIREYALYQNGSDAGVSFFKGTVDAHGNEPFVRFMDYPGDPVVASNAYVGFSALTRRATPPIGKCGLTPRGCRRVALDNNTLHRCQIRSGHDRMGLDTGGSDPQDILIFGNTVEDAYIQHKPGHGKSKRIHVIRNRFLRPHTNNPVSLFGVTDGTVTDNVWLDGPAAWTPMAWDNVHALIARNGNGVPFDPNVRLREKIAAVDRELEGLKARQVKLNAVRASLVSQLV